MKMLRKNGKGILKFIMVLSVIIALFFCFGVLGNRFWLTTQIATVLYMMVLPFLILFMIAAVIIDMLVLKKKKEKKRFWQIHVIAAALALAVLTCETISFKTAAKAGNGSYSLLRGLTMKDIRMSEPDEQVVYANHDGQDLSISIYKPNTESKALRPVYVYMHGGGWCSGNADTNSNFHRQMADAGYIGFSINYRLCTSGSYDHPTWDKAIYDCSEAMNWIKDHAEEYGGDASHIILAGESAGGNLVLQYAGMTSLGLLDAPVPNAVLAMYPAIDLQWTAENGHYLTPTVIPDIVEAYLGGKLDEYPDRLKFVSPLTYMNADLPPILIIHGQKDALVGIEGSREYKKEADAIGADVQLIELPYSNHGTDQQVNRTALFHWLKSMDGMFPEEN